MRKLLLATSALLSASVGMAGMATAGTLAPNAPNPAPGSITVTFNALVESFMFSESDTGTGRLRTAGTPSQKTNSFGIYDYARLYPSFDGALANGVKYGGAIEIRQRSTLGNASSNVNDQSLYIQREYLYVGTDTIGKFYIGDQVQPSALFLTGNPAQFGTGGWDGDLPGVFTQGIKYFTDDENDQANKIVYVSPQFSGFDFGLSYEPNSFGRNTGEAYGRATSVGSATSFSLPSSVNTASSTGNSSSSSSSPNGALTPTVANGAQYGARLNTVDGAARYTGSFGSFGVKIDGSFEYGGSVKSSVGAPSYQDLSVYNGGIAVTFGGFEVDGIYTGGKYGDSKSPLPQGATGTDGWAAGGSYSFGPFLVGGAYHGYSSGETKATVGNGNLTGYGLAAGANYTLAPGATVFLDYLYGEQTQKNVAGDIHNHAQGIGVGTAFKW